MDEGRNPQGQVEHSPHSRLEHTLEAPDHRALKRAEQMLGPKWNLGLHLGLVVFVQGQAVV